MTATRPGPDPKIAVWIARTLILSCVIVALSGIYLLSSLHQTVAGLALIGAAVIDALLAVAFLRRTRTSAPP